MAHPTLIFSWSAMAGILIVYQSLATELLVDIKSLAGKSKLEFAELMGAPKQCKSSKTRETCVFNAPDMEVVFIAGRADWMTIYPQTQIKFNEKALEYLGLGPALPIKKGTFAMHWQSLGGIETVSIVNSGRYVEFFHVRAYTPHSSEN